MADVQWVLHHVPPGGGQVAASVLRDGKTTEFKLDLPKGWRQQDDISWRASSWELRRMSLGGMFLKSISPELRAERKLPETGLALKVEHVGQYSPHDVAKRAGFRAGDVLVAFDGRTDLVRETDLINYSLHRKDKSPVPIEVLREGKKLTLSLPVERIGER